jgi:type 1 glutamine amidotransferase
MKILPRLALVLVTFFTTAFAAEQRPLRALLVIGGCCHDYPVQKDLLKRGLEERANLVVDLAYTSGTEKQARFSHYEKAGWAKGYDVIIHDECTSAAIEPAYVANVLAPHRDGLPAVNLHCAMHSYRTGNDEWFEFCGIQSSRHGPKLPIAVTVLDPKHPTMRGAQAWTTGNEELYNNVKVFPSATPLMQGVQKTPKGDDTAVVTWTSLYRGKTRVFSTTLGHTNETVGDARYLDLVAHGLLWACGKLRDDGTPSPGYGPVKR